MICNLVLVHDKHLSIYSEFSTLDDLSFEVGLSPTFMSVGDTFIVALLLFVSIMSSIGWGFQCEIVCSTIVQLPLRNRLVVHQLLVWLIFEQTQKEEDGD